MGHKKQAHSCWRAGKTGQQPKYDPVKQRPEEEQLLQQRQEAWEAAGSSTTPLWDAQNKVYYQNIKRLWLTLLDVR